jgi:formate dehydrogenase subunit gamma
MAFESWSPERAGEIIGAHRYRPGATLPILHALQDVFGCVPAEAVPLVAEALNLSRAEIHGVVSFYHDFRAAPPGRTVVKLCRAEACQAVGSEELATEMEQRLGVKFGQTTADKRVTLEAVYCLGNCACGPSGLIDGKLEAYLDAGKVEAKIAQAERRGAERRGRN